MLSEFEASLMRILIDNLGAKPEEVGELLEEPRRHARELVRRAVEMKLAGGRRLCHLLCQYWEKPLVNLSFPYRRFLHHFNRPIEGMLEHDLLPLDFAEDTVTVASYYVPEREVLKGLEEELGKPISLYLADVEQVSEGLKLLRERKERYQRAESVDCGRDKKRFVRLVKVGWPARVREAFAGSTILIEFERGGTLTKKLVAMDPSEPTQLVHYLVGKVMVHHVTEGETVAGLVESFPQSIGLFEGELKDALTRLRLAPMLLEGEKKD